MKKATILGKCLNIAASARRSVIVKANEFIKKFGVEKAKLLLSTQGKTIAELKGEYTAKQLKEFQGYIVSGDLMSFVELKRIVESHEFVKDYYGLTRAKEHAESNYTAPELRDALKQAIADVESCQ